MNTNAYWIGGRLARTGTMLSRVETVDDDLGEISAALHGTFERRADFVVVVGGLGPTPDDMTLKGVAKALKSKLRTSAVALGMVKRHYDEVGRGRVKMTKERMKMALIPEGATPLGNEWGMAPGVRLEAGSAVVFCLPGVPREMRGIFLRRVEPEIKAKLGDLWRSGVRLRIEGVYESDLAPLIKKQAEEHPGAYIKSHPRGVKEGISELELDAVVVKRTAADADSEIGEIASAFTAWVERNGGSVVQLKESRTGNRP